MNLLQGMSRTTGIGLAMYAVSQGKKPYHCDAIIPGLSEPLHELS